MLKTLNVNTSTIVEVLARTAEAALAKGALESHLGALINQMQPQVIEPHLLPLPALRQGTADHDLLALNAIGQRVVNEVEVAVSFRVKRDGDALKRLLLSFLVIQAVLEQLIL